MQVQTTPKPFYLISSYMLLFIVCNNQIGVSIFGFQRYIYRYAGHDAWVAVILAGLLAHLSAWMIIRTLQHYNSSDLYGIHYDLFGNWIGGMLSAFYMIYFVIIMTTIVRTYIEAVQSWIFPDFPTWLLSAILLLLALYGGTGGIRVIAGVCVFSFLIIVSVVIFYYYPLKYAEWSRLKPVMEATPAQIANATIKMGFSVAGFEIIYFIFPFLKDKSGAQRYTQMSMLFTNVIYLIIMLVSIGYFSERQFLTNIWGSTNLLKIIKYPFLERLEYIALPAWMLVVLPGLLITSWSFSRGMKQLFRCNQKITLFVLCGVVFIGSISFQDREQINSLNDFINRISVYFSFVYPLLLFIIAGIILKARKKRGEGKNQ